MHICIPLQQPLNHTSDTNNLQLATHFGAAQSFAVINSVDGQIIGECAVLKNCAGPCKCPLPDLADANLKVDALAGATIGYRLLQMSRRSDIPAYITKATTVGELRQQMPEIKYHRVRMAQCFSRSQNKKCEGY